MLLDVGIKVDITSVKELWYPVSGSSWYALGSVTIDKIIYDFRYNYGYLHIHRAPWEGDEIPLKRAPPK